MPKLAISGIELSIEHIDGDAVSGRENPVVLIGVLGPAGRRSRTEILGEQTNELEGASP